MMTMTNSAPKMPADYKAGKWTNPATECDHHAVLNEAGMPVAILPLENGTPELARLMAAAPYLLHTLELVHARFVKPLVDKSHLMPAPVSRSLVAIFTMAEISLMLAKPRPTAERRQSFYGGFPMPPLMPRANWPRSEERPCPTAAKTPVGAATLEFARLRGIDLTDDGEKPEGEPYASVS